MKHEYAYQSDKITLFYKRYVAEPKWLTKLLSRIKEDFNSSNFRSLEQVKEYFKTLDIDKRNFEIKERVGGTWVGGSIYSIDIEFSLKRFPMPIIQVSERFKPNEKKL
ncbi:hypothetical protein [Leeuwenhoekiella sp. MAR_2009_132]|uniref:hypothetical protein n=1 Tax=Leeuwenhoekiella sp. MAR_2009_132 TaxID=1392489 RepID=UPI00048C311B|nr:hypothetical protein [Leeuwenhoekiella sp. MAR_2009_132]